MATYLIPFTPEAAQEARQRAAPLWRLPLGESDSPIVKLLRFILEPPPGSLIPPIIPPVRATIAGGLAGPLYHGTSTKVLDSIMKKGLLPSTETGIQHYTGALESKLPATYFARSPSYAAGIALHTAASLGGDPVLLRVKQLPVTRFFPDEDVLTGFGKMSGVAQRYWPASFRLSQGAFSDVLERALKRPDVAARHTGGFLDEFFKVLEQFRPSGGIIHKGYTPLGTVAYKGGVPPEIIQIAARSSPRAWWGPTVKAEYETFVRQLADLLADYLARGQRPPWWLR